MKKTIRNLLVIVTCIIPTSVYASEISNDLSTEYSTNLQDGKLEKRAQEINDYLVKLEELKIQLEKSTEEIKTKGGMVTFEAISAHENIQQQLNYYENSSLEIVGLEKLETETSPLVQPLSTKADATITAPTVYYDTDSSAYVASSGWQWSKINPDNNNSGDDQFALYNIQEPLALISTHLNLFKYDGTKEHIATPNHFLLSLSDKKFYGYRQIFADSGVYRDYRAHSGVSWMFFRFQNGSPKGKTLNFEGIYTHTWSSTKIDGIGFDISGLRVSFTNGSDGWSKSNFSAIKF